MGSPTSRSLKYLRDQGMIAEKVEQRLPIPGKFITRDLFNFIDIIAVDSTNGAGLIGAHIYGVQATSMSNFNARKQKILAEPLAAKWKQGGGIIVLHGWGKKCKDGVRGARKVWTLREEAV